MTIELIQEQLCVSTADDERNYFTGEPVVEPSADIQRVMPSGLYRVIDGELFRIVGLPLMQTGQQD